jgi:uncharacterized protein (TIRG00374 family)
MSGQVSGVLKVAVTALILAFIAWQFDFSAVTSTLSTISAFAAVAAVLVVFVQTIFTAERLVMVTALFGVRFPVRDSLKVILEGMFFSHTFLSFLGGDAMRIWRIRRYGLPVMDATSAVVLDRLIGILINHVFLLASLPWLLMHVKDESVKFALVLLALAGVGGFAAILLLGSLRGRRGYLHRLRARIPIRSVAMLLVEASTVGRHFLAQYRHLVRASFVSVLIAAANMLVFAIILLGMGVDLSLTIGCSLLVPAVLEIAMIPVSIAGLGLREGAAAVAFGALGLPVDQALGSSLAYGLAVAIVSLSGGMMWLSDRRRKAPMISKDQHHAQPARAGRSD